PRRGGSGAVRCRAGGSDPIQARLGAREPLGGPARGRPESGRVRRRSRSRVPRQVARASGTLRAVSTGHRMTDTPPDVDARYRQMLLARSGDDRLRMGFSMYATARALVVASILASEPGASPARIREAIFLRFYGHEFDDATRERIAARIAEGP